MRIAIALIAASWTHFQSISSFELHLWLDHVTLAFTYLKDGIAKTPYFVTVKNFLRWDKTISLDLKVQSNTSQKTSNKLPNCKINVLLNAAINFLTLIMNFETQPVSRQNYIATYVCILPLPQHSTVGLSGEHGCFPTTYTGDTV